MKGLWRIELRRLMRNKGFWGILVLCIVINALQYRDITLLSVKYMDAVMAKLNSIKIGTLYPHSVYNNWIGGDLESYWHYVYFLLIPVIAVIPYSYTYNYDRKSKLTINYYIRAERKDYVIVKYIITFLAGAVVVTIPLVCNFVLTMMKLPLITPQASTGTYPLNGSDMFADIFYTRPMLYILIYFAVIFVYSGLMAVLPMGISYFTDNAFVQLSTPFIGNILVYCICNVRSMYRYVPLRFIDPAQDGGFTDAASAFAIILLLLIFNIVMAVRGMTDETL